MRYETDAALGNYFKVAVDGDLALANPINAAHGQRVTWELESAQRSTVTLGTDFQLGPDIPAVSLLRGMNWLTASYDANANSWRVLAFARGY